MEKKTFNNPVVEVVEILSEDILTASNVDFGPDDTSPGFVQDEFGNLIG